MKLLVVTCADESTTAYTKHTHPILRMFAERWEAEFRILSVPLNIRESCRLFELYNIFEDYDRIFYIDSDVVINKNCPNMFDIMPYDTIGLVFEDKGSRLENRRARIVPIRKGFGGAEHWTSGYFNMGVFICSKIHRDIFTKVNGQIWGDRLGFGQTHFNYQVMKRKYKHVDLGYKFNHMSMFSEEWNGSPSRFDSYIIHYAGAGSFPDKGKRSRIELMADDVRMIYG
ncbi:MAG: hypothetical protein KAV87_54330 [Desulfobacteraceae bacterium]|nr:hypothetical protein [Desulfobacteraceae bacterium]